MVSAMALVRSESRFHDASRGTKRRRLPYSPAAAGGIPPPHPATALPIRTQATESSDGLCRWSANFLSRKTPNRATVK